VPALIALVLVGACAASQPAATLVLRGGRVYTADPAHGWAEAIAVRGDTIAAVGSNAEIARWVGPGTRVVELAGRPVLPGFIDTHIHFLEGSLLLGQVKLDQARSLPEMLAIVKAYAEAHPDAPWIEGMGWNYSFVEGGRRLPTRQDLDAVVPDRPVYLQAYDAHTAWVNSKALEVAGLDRRAELHGFGEIVRDATGEPTGVLKERDAMALVHKAIPAPTHAEKLAALRRGLAEAARLGITSIHIAHGSPTVEPSPPHAPDELDLYEELARAGELTVRVYMAMSVGKDTSDATLDRWVALAHRLRGPWVKAGAVKIVMDGVIESHTAGMLAPYSDDGSTSGSPAFTQAELDALVARLDRRGFQIFTHAIGDRSVRMVLDAYARVRAADPARPRRHRIEHIEVTTAEDVPRFAALGVIASMQPYHASPDLNGAWDRAVGPERIALAFAWRSLRDAGARVIYGSDWPVVTQDPLVGLHAAVTREDLSGKPAGGWIPAQRLTLEQAIRGYTSDAAYASFDEDNRGSLAPGKLADLVVLSQDLFAIDPRRIADVKVVMTVVGGETRYAAPRPTLSWRTPSGSSSTSSGRGGK
jgi:predicted amidohydrolase YtcJ